MGKTSQMFLSVSEVQGLLGMSKSYCYELVAKLNDELERMDKIVIPGKVPTQFFLEKFYGMEITDEMQKLFTATPAVSRRIKSEGKLEAKIHYAGLTEG